MTLKRFFTTVNTLACAVLLLGAQTAHSLDDYGKPDDPVAAEALDVKIRTKNPDEMAYAIKVVLLKDYMKNNKIRASDKEIAQVLERKKQARADIIKQAKARQAEIQTALQSDATQGEQRKKLEEEQRFIDEMLKRAAQADSQAGDPKREGAEIEMAAGMIEQWKVNQSLYKEYGGRVIMQQTGPEPLDAYHEYFKAVQKAGNLKILNQEFESTMWSYFTDDKKHRFVPDSDKDKVMNTPWWQLPPAPSR
jgi:hypothetical protein